MKVVRLLPDNLEKTAKEVLAQLKKGKVVVCPTDTIYGLLCDATNAKAIEKIFLIKKRNKQKPLSVFVRNIAMARQFAKINTTQEHFLKKAWPGKVTVVLLSKNKLPKEMGTVQTVGLRIPKHPFISLLLKKYNRPLAQTSVNISGEPPLNDVQRMVRVFQKRKHRPDFLFSAGKLPFSKPSSVVDLTDKTAKILRK